MSEEAKATEGGKKKGKLPMILGLVLVLGAGGFFGMKMKGGGEHKEPEIKLGEIVPLEEFLVNLKGGSTYLRTEVALQFKEGFKKEEADKNMPALRDAIVLLLSSQSLSQVSSLEGKEALKLELAKRINHVLESLAPAEGKHKQKKDEKGEGKEKSDEEHKEGEPPAEPQERAHPDWQSDKGPVLRVYFNSFATQ